MDIFNVKDFFDASQVFTFFTFTMVHTYESLQGDALPYTYTASNIEECVMHTWN
jgi:hypothetical protein